MHLSKNAKSRPPSAALCAPDDRRARRLLFIAALLCVLVLILSLPLPRLDGQLIGSDGKFYYSILRSLVFDGDFDFANDYHILKVDTIDSIGITAIGKNTNPFAMGTALLWLPFFILAYGIALLLNLLGFSVTTDGSSNLYQGFVCCGTVSYAAVGFALSYRLARRWYSPSAVLSAVLALWFASPAIYYMLGQPSMAHALSIFTNACFLTLWLSWRKKNKLSSSVYLGLVTGLMALVRWQDSIFILFPLAEGVWRTARGEWPIAQGVLRSILLVFSAIVVFVPQFIMWQQVYGTPLTLPQGSAFMQWLAPNPLQTLVSTRHGLISWHPIFAAALLGLVPLGRRHPRLAVAVLVMFLIQLYINSAVERWWADEAFGGRRFTGLLPALSLPLAALCNSFMRRGWRRFLLISIILLVVWNSLCFAQFRLGWISKRDALTWQEMTIDRLRLPLKILAERRLTPR